MRIREEKPTVEMCYHRGENKDPCAQIPTWKVSNSEKGYRFKVCDVHLAWSLRLCGLPAIVEEYDCKVISL